LNSTDDDLQTALETINNLKTLENYGLWTDTTVNLTTSMSESQRQAEIDAIPKYIHDGVTLTFQFADGTHTANTEIVFSGFYGGGLIEILGNATNNSLSTTKAVTIDASGGEMAIRILSCRVSEIHVNYLKINFNTSYIGIGINVNHTSSVINLNYNYIYGTGTANGYGLYIRFAPTITAHNNYFSNSKVAITVKDSTSLYSLDNDDTGTMPLYGLYSYSAMIFKGGTQPAGSTASEYKLNGGRIWP
jgi:hypothetical protein